MVDNYRVSDVHIFEGEVFMRAATLSASEKSQKNIGRAVDRSIDKKVYNRHIPRLGNYINESYINIDIENLRQIDNDDVKRASFIGNNTKFLDKNLLNIFFIKLIIRSNEQIKESDLEYLNQMLMWEMNDIYVMPTLEFDDSVGRPDRVRIYSDFVARMLEMKDRLVPGKLNVGLSVPLYFSKKQIGELFSLYRNEPVAPTFVSIDYGNTRVSDPKQMGKVLTTIKQFRENNEEKYFMYALNARPYKRGETHPIAEDLGLAKTGFNGFGGPHYPPAPRYVPPATEWSQLGKIFENYDHRYYPLSEEGPRNEFLTWAENDYSIDELKPPREIAGVVRPIVKRYNFCKVNEELKEISDAVRKSDDDYLNNKPR